MMQNPNEKEANYIAKHPEIFEDRNLNRTKTQKKQSTQPNPNTGYRINPNQKDVDYIRKHPEIFDNLSAVHISKQESIKPKSNTGYVLKDPIKLSRKPVEKAKDKQIGEDKPVVNNESEDNLDDDLDDDLDDYIDETAPDLPDYEPSAKDIENKKYQEAMARAEEELQEQDLNDFLKELPDDAVPDKIDLPSPDDNLNGKEKIDLPVANDAPKEIEDGHIEFHHHGLM